MSGQTYNSTRVQHFIIRKLTRAEATSQENAVSVEEAGLTVQEESWLSYFTSGWYSKIGKTKNSKYYVKES
jgi:hypothetical protein